MIPQNLFCVIGGCRDLRLFHVELREIYVAPEKILLREFFCVIDCAKLSQSPPKCTKNLLRLFFSWESFLYFLRLFSEPLRGYSAISQRGRERTGPPEIINRNFVSESGQFRVRISLADSYGKNRAPFWPFLGEGFGGNIRRPLLLPALSFTSDL